MTTFEENAEQFGVGAPAEDYSEEIYAPVRLSNSTRRMMTPTEMVQERVNTFSPAGRMIREQEAARQKELLEIDRMEDEAYAREIEKRAKAAAWNDKVLAQQHASQVIDSLVDLNPTDPDFLAKKDSLVGQYPMALLDDRVKGVLDSKSSIFEIARQERDKAEALAQRQTERQEAREDNQQFQMDSARIAREENQRYDIEKDVTKLSPEAQTAYRAAVASGKSVTEAAGLARAEDSKIITKDEYNAASDRVVDINRAIDRARTLLSQQPDALSSTDPDFMEQFKTQQGELRQELNEYRVERDRLRSEILRPYEDRVAGEKPKPNKDVAGNPGSTVPQGDSPRSAKPGSPMSVKSLLPTQ